MSESCRNVFCYGSLRPDDDSGMPWTKDAVEGMIAQPAVMYSARLYEDKYANLNFCDDPTSKVVGWVLTCDSETDFEKKLSLFDEIEEYYEDDPESSEYLRAIADACLGDPRMSVGGRSLGEEGSVVKAYVYHNPNCAKDRPILSGDWLQRSSK